MLIAARYPLVIIPKNRKGPMGTGWPKRHPSPDAVQRAVDAGKNVGIILGLASGVVDFEVDGPGGEESLHKLFNGEPIPAPCWSSTRGRHRLYQYDDRFAGLGTKFTHDEYPGLEFRIGAEAAQSVIPPSEVDGFRREWQIDIVDVPPPPLPEAVILAILGLRTSTTTTVAFGRSGYDALDSIEDDIRSSVRSRLEAWHERYDIPVRIVHGEDKDKFTYPYCPIRGPQHADGGAVIFVNADGSYAFHCSHNKCAGKTFDDLQTIYGPFEPPIIKIDHDINRMTDEALHALRGADNVYQRGVLVEIVHPVCQPKQCLSDNGAPRLRPMPKAALDPILSAIAKWRKPSFRGWVPAPPPLRVVDAVLSKANPRGIRVVTGVVSSPVLRADGSILSTPGYDKSTGLYLDIDGEFPPLMPVKDALAALFDIVVDFPFASREHRSTWLAALITLLSRHAFAGCAPFFLFDGNVSRVGKGLLTDLLTMISEGRKAARCDYSDDKNEMAKFLTSVVVAGSPYILFDNVKGKFGGRTLEGILTTGRWSARLLGGNQTIDVPFTSVCLGTSNNATMTADMIGRTCHCRLETMMERPGERTGFRHDDVLEYVRKNRHKLAIAALSIPAAYIEAGRPDKNLSGWGGFEPWSDLVRSSIVWAGEPDCDTRLKLAQQSDDETGLLSQVMDGWAELGKPMSVADAITAARSGHAPSLHVAMDEIHDARALGNLLKQYRRRVVDGRYFDHNDKKIPKWHLVRLNRTCTSDIAPTPQAESGPSTET